MTGSRKRKPINSADEAVRTMMAAALGPPAVPAHVTLRGIDKPFWDGIVRVRAREEWTGPDLVVACQLARCQADVETESALCDAEGSIITNERGTRVVNPRAALLEQLARREMALMRALRIGGSAAGDVRNELVRRAAAVSAARDLDQLPDDGLLAH